MSDTSVQPVAESTPGLSQLARITNTFTAPSKTFTDIKNGHRSWWMPFLIYAVLGYVFFFAVNSKIGMRQVMENQINLSPKAQERMQQATPEAREQQMKISTYVTEGVFLAGPVFLIIMGLVISGVMLGTINFGFGGRAKFGSVLSVWMYAMLPSIFKTLLGIIVIYAGAAPESFNIKNFAPTNVGAFLNPADVGPAIYSLATSIDIVTIWTLILVGIGTATVAGVKRSSGYIAAFGWWILVVLIGVGWNAAFS
ncbi:Yip1 family protein [Occallatibacter riparius]|uniref:YIP1 family protein n=1 Tax=Occallatibacter riparius TaxID=1002689 RepID=A0A9J7BUV5_9BACT|nr:Yip1 family protein [Occallatibacter riparius]UWZ86447.1 YIP1 family protein [Occallatibacter riparius]